MAFSGEVTDPDYPSRSSPSPGSTAFRRASCPKRFHRRDFQVLVVAEKYQTGFDEPLLHTMYVDKKLAGVKAVQTLSRLNRTHPGKEDTFVLDFANSAEEIQAAFEPFFEESFAAPTDPNVLYTLEHDLKAADVLSPQEIASGRDGAALRGHEPASSIYANLTPAVGRFAGSTKTHRTRSGARLTTSSGRTRLSPR